MDQQKQLVAQLNKRINSSLKTFFESFYPSVCVFAKKYVKDTDLAEGIAQEAFLSFWTNKNTFPNINSLKGFIYTTTRNLCLNHLKAKEIRDKINQGQLVSESFFHDLIVEEETYKIIHQAVEKLPKQSRNIIQLSLKGYKNPEIASELNISVNTVKTLKKKAYAALRENLQEHLYILFILSQLSFQ